MMHTSADFAQHMLGLLKNSGTSGHSGHGLDNQLKSIDKNGTTRTTPVVPVKPDWSRPPRASGTNFNTLKQQLKTPVTSVTTGTAIFQHGRVTGSSGQSPAEWHAILARLKARDPVEWLPEDRWAQLLSDAEIFLSTWGEIAHQLGWTTLDLFGVHPTAPASRFDVMGLIPLLCGDQIIAITEETATIRRSAGVLTFRRPPSGAVCISEALPCTV